MKKIILIYFLILVGIFAVLFALGRSSDNSIERKVWKIYRQQIDIAKDPTVVPDQTFEQVENGYRQIIEKYPDSRLIPAIHIRLGEVYELKGDYEAARKIFYETIKLYPDKIELLAEAMFKVGKTYEADQDWEKANAVYADIIKDYPQTNIALNVPIYIANHYKRQNDFQKTMKAYEAAISHYLKLASDYKGTRTGLNALRYLSNCYLDQNRWNEAINTLGSILEKYTTSDRLTIKNVEVIIKTINVVSAYQIKDYDVAVDLYQGIIDRNPAHPLQSYLKKVIDAFKQLKEKGIQVSDR